MRARTPPPRPRAARASTARPPRRTRRARATAARASRATARRSAAPGRRVRDRRRARATTARAAARTPVPTARSRERKTTSASRPHGGRLRGRERPSERQLALGGLPAAQLHGLGAGRRALLLHQPLDALLGLVQDLGELLLELHPLLVAGDRVLERKLAGLELGHDLLQPVHRLLEVELLAVTSAGVGLRARHRCLPCVWWSRSRRPRRARTPVSRHRPRRAPRRCARTYRRAPSRARSRARARASATAPAAGPRARSPAAAGRASSTRPGR